MAERPKLTLEERRARRAERREKQRIANVGRAKKMHAARLAYERLSDRTEPAPPRITKRVKQTPILHVGCSGWFYWHWKGQFYPAELPTSQWFKHYVSQFDTVELNAPFYAWPTVGTVSTWKTQPGDRPFVYAVKVCELITHVKRFVGTKTLVKDFGHIADLLGDRFGCFLFQLPPSYHYTPGRLKSIVTQLEPHRKNVVEFRHKSWWNEKVYAAFKKQGILFCSCSGPRLPDELIKTADDIYVRFHGTKQWYRHDYTADELSIWAKRIRDSGARQAWCYFNNDREGYAIKNAAVLRQLIGEWNWEGSSTAT